MDTPLLTRLQAQLERRMREKRFNMKSLSRAAGQVDNYVSNIMRGRIKEPSLYRMKRIADQLECPLDDLLEEPQSVALPTVTAREAQNALVDAVKWVEAVAAHMAKPLSPEIKGVVIAKLSEFIASGGGQIEPEVYQKLVRTLIQTAAESMYAAAHLPVSEKVTA